MYTDEVRRGGRKVPSPGLGLERTLQFPQRVDQGRGGTASLSDGGHGSAHFQVSGVLGDGRRALLRDERSEEHTSELQSR